MLPYVIHVLVIVLLVPQNAIAQLSLPSSPWLPPNASSGAVPSTTDRSPNPQWITLLGDLIYFYEEQRSGTLPSTNRVSWRNSSAVDDGEDVGLDLSGGYYDAGDYIKATFPLAFTAMSICWGANDFGQGYDLANQTAYLDDMIRWTMDWLMKAHPSNNTLYVQVADGNLDDAYWGGDLGIPTPRPSYQINDTAPGTDAAAGTAAAFSACSALYANRALGGTSSNTTNTTTSPFSAPASLQNSTYATLLLSHAEALHEFATNATAGLQTYQTSVPEAGTAYASSSYGDELAISALMLAWASNSSDRYEEAVGYWQDYGLSGQDQVFNWDSKGPGFAVLATQLSLVEPGLVGNLTGWQSEAESYFDTIVNGTGRSSQTDGGLLWYPGDSDEVSLNPALNAAMLLARYAPIASTDDKKTSYLNFANQQLNYVLGKNPMNAPYIVGTNPNAPANPHSAMASGGNDISNIDTDPETEAYVLYGAVVGGPDPSDKFWDIRSDWVETEVALDYNAPMLTLAAWHVLNDSSDPFYTSLAAGSYSRPKGSPCDAALPCPIPPLSWKGKVGMGVAIGVVGLVIVGLTLYLLIAGRRNKVG
ncbi:family 9 glycosyl hydrolase [Stereum hirsutum FP-91666 SS1]|uniref:family 9 glycosyl hydrolase n=1 Tax=Stereum hirsutum (strain FP-91666) TaxID=721885 RepID=UPI000440BE09|nr:family 9 glycosyl hydrolase [Stereum hirsutum FP-91666 SS1]EIM88135.1 family 9 glycosyl hydrolase [Stereum hirsutum FP-91666 SS1]